MIFIPIQESFAQDIESSPIIYDSNIELIHIGEIDEKSGTYCMDFFFYMTSNDNGVDFTKHVPEIDFMNARDIDVKEPHIT